MIIFDPLLGKLSMHPPGIPGPAGTVNVSSNNFTATSGQTAFVCSHAIQAGSAVVTINGLRQPSAEYSVSGATVTFNDGTGVTAGDIIVVSYLY
jgi:hypothetical protein